MRQHTIKLRKIDDYRQLQVQQDIQRRLMKFKAEEWRWVQPKKKGAKPIKKRFSDEAIMEEIDHVCLHSGINFYTPLSDKGDIQGWQHQTLFADMLSSRRRLTYFRTVDSDGNMAHPPRDAMCPLVIEAFLDGYDLLKHIKKQE